MANLTLEDIANISFPKANFGGYRAEDVDAFIDDVQVSYDNLSKENAELKRKLAILAQKVEEYRNEEDSIRSTLLSAQKLADASVREAKHKAEVIVADATEKAERIILGAQKEAESQQGELGRLKDEVAAFRTKLLTIYKEHLQIIQQLPSEEEVTKEKEAQAAQTAEPAEIVEEPEAPQPEIVEAAPQETPPAEEKAEEAVAVDPKDMEKTKVYEPVGYTETPMPQAAPMAPPDGAQPIEDQLPSRFSSLKFGEDYDLKNDAEESPINNMFKKRK